MYSLETIIIKPEYFIAVKKPVGFKQEIRHYIVSIFNPEVQYIISEQNYNDLKKQGMTLDGFGCRKDE